MNEHEMWSSTHTIGLYGGHDLWNAMVLDNIEWLHLEQIGFVAFSRMVV